MQENITNPEEQALIAKISDEIHQSIMRIVSEDTKLNTVLTAAHKFLMGFIFSVDGVYKNNSQSSHFMNLDDKKIMKVTTIVEVDDIPEITNDEKAEEAK